MPALEKTNESFKKRGYFMYWRAFSDDPLYKKKRHFSQWEAWLYLYAEASGVERMVEFRRASIKLKRGQLATTYRSLAQHWRWSLGSVQNFLAKLRRRNSIEVSVYHKSRRFIIITIKKYEELNPLDNKI